MGLGVCCQSPRLHRRRSSRSPGRSFFDGQLESTVDAEHGAKTAKRRLLSELSWDHPGNEITTRRRLGFVDEVRISGALVILNLKVRGRWGRQSFDVQSMTFDAVGAKLYPRGLASAYAATSTEAFPRGY